MLDTAKKISYTMAGCAALTARRAHRSACHTRDTLAEAEAEGRKQVDALREHGAEKWNRLETRVAGFVRKEIRHLGLPTRQDFEALRAQVETLGELAHKEAAAVDARLTRLEQAMATK